MDWSEWDGVAIEATDKQAWFPCYGEALLGDVALQTCSLPARAIAQNFFAYVGCVSPRRGLFVMPNGECPTDEEAAGILRCTVKEAVDCIAELERKKVLRRTAEGVLFSLGMVRRAMRSASSKKSAEKRWQKNRCESNQDDSTIRNANSVVVASESHCVPSTTSNSLRSDLSEVEEAPQKQPKQLPLVDDSETVLVFPAVGKGPSEWHLRKKTLDELQRSFPALDVRDQVTRARAKIVIGACDTPTHRGYPRFIGNWLDRANRNPAERVNGVGSAVAPKPTRKSRGVDFDAPLIPTKAYHEDPPPKPEPDDDEPDFEGAKRIRNGVAERRVWGTT